MSHRTIIIGASLLDIFNPEDPEYQGTRDHFSAGKLAKIDELRSRDPETAAYSFDEKLFICWAISKAVMTAEND